MNSSWKMPVRVIGALAVIMSLTNCQHRTKSGDEVQAANWHVMERVGEVRAAKENGSELPQLRPGEAIGEHSLVSTGDGALLILSGEGIQLTAGEKTSFRLPFPTTARSLDLDHGWLRIRLATATNRKTRIKTDHFDINASGTTFTMRAGPHGTDLSVEAGSVVLATADGQHHATLVAGAAAKIDRRSGNNLLIRRASGQAFAKVAPLDDRIHHRDGVPRPKTVKTNVGAKGAAAKAAHAADLTSTEASKAAHSSATIIPASRLKKANLDRPEIKKPGENVSRSPAPDTSQPQERPPSAASTIRLSGRQQLAAVNGVNGDSRPSENSNRPQTRALDPLQARYDRLTEGLLDGL